MNMTCNKNKNTEKEFVKRFDLSSDVQSTEYSIKGDSTNKLSTTYYLKSKYYIRGRISQDMQSLY